MAAGKQLHGNLTPAHADGCAAQCFEGVQRGSLIILSVHPRHRLPHLFRGLVLSLTCLVGVPSCGLATGSWRTGRPAQRRQIVSVCLILRRRPPAGLSLSRSYLGTPRGKGENTQRPALGQFRSKPRMEIISFVSSRRRKSSSTWGRGKPSRS